MKESTQNLIIKTNLKAQIEGKQILPICLYGAPGVGKSATIKQATKDIKATEVTYSISSTNFELFTGLPNFSVDSELDQYSNSGAKDVQNTIWTIPDIIAMTNRAAEKNPNGAVLHLEDLHTSDQNVEKIMYQLLLDKRIGDYNLHPKVAIICSMNDSQESGGGKFNSAAVKSRLSLMPYVFNFDTWYEQFGSTLHKWISSFLKANNQYVLEPENKTLEPSASARSWTKLSEEFELYDDIMLNETYQIMAKGKVSPQAVLALEKHVIYYQKMDFKSLVKKQFIPNLNNLKELDKVLWSYVFHYIETPKDAVYLITLINDLMQQDHYESVVGFMSGEIYSVYMQQSKGETISKGQQIVLDKLLGSFDATTYKGSDDVKEIVFNDSTTLTTLISQYM